ncbi:hypothetical protein GCM10019016_009540 [Streptomyces prasinosporus]|uniref:Uncharacterized protein n=1 Tax=Streptomyces prasinosporus TaxID=68256 RepID=A0ABP6TFA1_9ACTN|nr:hypothetical protein GCM10010332_64180 [Streptomyces albogriseolus]
MSSGYGLTPTTKALHVSFSYVFDTADCTDGEASVSPFSVLDVLQVHVREAGSMPYLTARVSSTAHDLTPDRACTPGPRRPHYPPVRHELTRAAVSRPVRHRRCSASGVRVAGDAGTGDGSLRAVLTHVRDELPSPKGGPAAHLLAVRLA